MRAIVGLIGRSTLAGVALCLALSPAVSAGASKEELDAKVREATQELYKTSSAAKELSGRAAGIVVFPQVLKAGFVIGGEYGEGALLIGGKTAAYYNIVSASWGLQIGAQQKSLVLMFMTAEALKKFRDSDGWKAGVDGSVALATLGAGKDLDSETLQKPIIGFVYNNKGLMANLTLEGSKITKIDK